MFQAKIMLNSTEVKGWIIFLHNKNHAFLDFTKGYGGAYSTVNSERMAKSTMKMETWVTFSLSMDITKSLTTERSHHCINTPEGELFDMDACLAKFYARNLTCTSPWEDNSNIDHIPLCETANQYKGIFHVDVVKLLICDLTFQCIFSRLLSP